MDDRLKLVISVDFPFIKGGTGMKAVIHIFLGALTIFLILLVIYVAVSVIFPLAGDRIVSELGELTSVAGNLMP